jgi:basic membrane protein A
MKKLLSLLLAAGLVFSLVACGPKEEEPTPEPEEPVVEDTIEIALVTDVGTIDDKSFNQGAWEGVVAYAEANDKTYDYYQPAEKTTDAYVDAIELAVEDGAKIIVTPGFLFENAIWVAQTEWPDVNFILLDGAPHNVTDWDTMSTYDGSDADFTIESNVASIFYAEHESGFLAGYAAVKDGYTKLGFMGGMAVPAVVRFGYGFVEGANYAAAEMGIEIEVEYKYLGVFWPTDEVQNSSAAWFTSGTEVIFAAAGGAGSSVMKAAEQNDGMVIGVDINQAGDSETVITSAMKGLANSVEQALTEFYAGSFAGGEKVTKTAKLGGVSLPSDFSRFKTFTQADYDAIFKVLVDEEYEFVLTADSDINLLTTEFAATTVNIQE